MLYTWICPRCCSRNVKAEIVKWTTDKGLSFIGSWSKDPVVYGYMQQVFWRIECSMCGFCFDVDEDEELILPKRKKIEEGTPVRKWIYQK